MLFRCVCKWPETQAYSPSRAFHACIQTIRRQKLCRFTGVQKCLLGPPYSVMFNLPLTTNGCNTFDLLSKAFDSFSLFSWPSSY
eukprot:jgi/Botrbrau1/8635/Bobra.0196s0029.1